MCVTRGQGGQHAWALPCMGEFVSVEEWRVLQGCEVGVNICSRAGAFKVAVAHLGVRGEVVM